MGVTFTAKVYKYQGSLIMIDKNGKAFYLKPGDYAGEFENRTDIDDQYIGEYTLET